ncbi:DUF1877 family protein [Streptomyces sp. NPDC003236]
MSGNLHLHAVPSSALRNSGTWLERQFLDHAVAERSRPSRYRAQVLDERYRDQERIYISARSCCAEGLPETHVVLGGRQVARSGRNTPRLLVLTAGQARHVARFLSATDFPALWASARGELLPRYGGTAAEPETREAFAGAHKALRAFYTQTAEEGYAVVKRLSA